MFGIGAAIGGIASAYGAIQSAKMARKTAKEQIQLQRENLAFQKDVYGEKQRYAEGAADLASKQAGYADSQAGLSDAQLELADAMSEQYGRGIDLADRQAALGESTFEFGAGTGMQLWDQYEQNYGPTDAKLAAMALEEGLPERYAQEAAADVTSSYDKQAAMDRRELSRYGLDPNSGLYAGAQRERGLSRAAAEAGAKTQGRRAGEDVQFERLKAAAAQGNTKAAQALQAYMAGASGAGAAYRDSDIAYRGAVDVLGAAGNQITKAGQHLSSASGMYGNAAGTLVNAGSSLDSGGVGSAYTSAADALGAQSAGYNDSAGNFAALAAYGLSNAFSGQKGNPAVPQVRPANYGASQDIGLG